MAIRRATRQAGSASSETRFTSTVYDVLIGDAAIADATVRQVQFKHLDVVPATPDLAGAEVELVDRQEPRANDAVGGLRRFGTTTTSSSSIARPRSGSSR